LFVTVASASDARLVLKQEPISKQGSFSLPYKMGGAVSKTNWNWWGSAIEVSAMIHLDVDVYTLPHLGTSCATSQILGTGVNDHGAYIAYLVTPEENRREINPVARCLFRNGIGHATTPLAALAVYGTGLLLKKIDRRLGWAFISAMKLAEMNAMHSWARQGLGPRDAVWSLVKIPI